MNSLPPAHSLSHAKEQLAELIDVLRSLDLERARAYWIAYDIDPGAEPGLPSMHRVRLDMEAHFTPEELEQSRQWLRDNGYGWAIDVPIPEDFEP